MPELPEVEVVKRSLEKKIKNLVIKKVVINDANLRYKVNQQEISKVHGHKIKKIERRSKFLIFKTEKNLCILVHLGMTGKFFFIDKKNNKHKTSFYYEINEDKDKKYDRVVFLLQNNRKLIYNDVRKFGFIKLLKTDKYLNCSHLKILGLEPLKNNCNFLYFKKYISGRIRRIKDILMDQKFISGLGNIYVNEILFLSGVRPQRKVKRLKDIEIVNILNNMKKILRKSIKVGGSTIKDFSSDDGKKGDFQQYFNVYGREGKKCSNIDCNEKIKRIVISNRATFFCKRCQK